MHSILDNLEEYLEQDDFTNLPAIVIAELEKDGLKIVDVVEKAGRWLTSTYKEQRKKAISVLSRVISLLQPDFLSEAECNHFVTFFTQSLADHYTITPPSLAALAALTSMKNLPDDAPRLIIAALQENVTCQALTVSSRHSFYSIFRNIYFNKKDKVLSEFPSDFLFGLISGMDSESDPKNLLYLFGFLPSVLSEIPLKHLAEDMFSVLECYFPVDFSPADSGDNISRNDLVQGLERCLSATDELAEFCIKMICEKLESTLKEAQIDSLNLLKSGCEVWNVVTLSSYMNPVWEGMKSCFLSGDTQISSFALSALLSLLRAFSTAPLGPNETSALSSLLNNILSYTFGYLADASLSRFTPTVKLLVEIASVSTVTAHRLIPPVLKQLLALTDSRLSSSTKDTILKALQLVLQLAVHSGPSVSDGDRIEDLVSKAIDLLLQCVEDPACRASAYQCLSASLPSLSDHQRSSVLQFIYKSVPLESSKENKESCAKLVSKFSEIYPEDIEKNFLSNVNVPDSSEDERKLELLTWIANGPELTIRSVTTLLGFIANPKHSITPVIILRDFTGSCDNRVLRTIAMECNGPMFLVQEYLSRTSTLNHDHLSAVFDIITNVIRTLEPSEQSCILNSALELIIPKLQGSQPSCAALYLFGGFIAGIHRGVSVNGVSEISNILIKMSIYLESPEARTTSAIVMALLINKSHNDHEVDAMLETAWKARCESVGLCSWICKALLLRAHPALDQWINQLVEFVLDEKLGMEGADGIRLLLDHDPYFSPQNHANIQLLYRQRVFEKVSFLMETREKPIKSALLAVAYVLKNCPPSLLIANLQKVSGVLVGCLDEEDEGIRSKVLDVLCRILSESQSYAGLLAQTFIPRCLSIATSSKTMVVRQGALRCLYLFACNFKPEDLMPYKNMVTNGLSKCLDDKKRLVRQEAVRARTKWFII